MKDGHFFIFLFWIFQEVNGNSINSNCSRESIILQATTAPRYITSPGYRNQSYDNNLHCQWLVQTANEDKIIRVQVLDSELESTECLYDRIDYYDGRSTSSDKLFTSCGQTLVTVYSSKPFLLIVFTTDDRLNYAGFKLEYKEVDNEEKDDTLIYASVLGGVGVMLGFVLVFCCCSVLKLQSRKITHGFPSGDLTQLSVMQRPTATPNATPFSSIRSPRVTAPPMPSLRNRLLEIVQLRREHRTANHRSLRGVIIKPPSYESSTTVPQAVPSEVGNRTPIPNSQSVQTSVAGHVTDEPPDYQEVDPHVATANDREIHSPPPAYTECNQFPDILEIQTTSSNTE